MPPNYQQQGQYVPPQQPYTATDVKKSHHAGLLIALVVLIIMFLGATVMWLMIATKYSELNNNFEQKLAAATEEASKEISAQKDAELAEKEKSPYETYQGPAAFGSIKIVYPKTWSAYVAESDRGATPVDGYFQPGFVPSVQSGTAFALHVEVTETDYDQLLRKYENDSKNGKVTVTPYKSGNTAGVRIDGELEKDKKGSVVLLPLRDKTIRLTAESEQFVGDFNDIILKNFTFVP